LTKCNTLHGLDWQSHIETAQHIVQQALQLAAAAPAHATPAVSAAAEGSPTNVHPQQQQGLRLTTFATDWLVSPGVLAALPAHSLTGLGLNLELTNTDLDAGYVAVSGLATAAALSRLSSLQHLSLGITHSILSSDISAACLDSIAQLSQLTSLNLYGSWEDAEEPVQQLVSQALPLRRLQLELVTAPGFQLPALDMSALTRLEHFVTCKLLSSGMVFPIQLRQLTLAACDIGSRLLAVVMPLQQLSSLSLEVQFQEWEALAQLAQLPALQELCLWYEDDAKAAITAAATAAAWPQLPQLQNLGIACDTPHDRQQLAAILSGVAGATSLVHLRMTQLVVRDDDNADAEQAAAAEDDDEEPEYVKVPAAVCSILANAFAELGPAGQPAVVRRCPRAHHTYQLN
jgi:hypothetical protein